MIRAIKRFAILALIGFASFAMAHLPLGLDLASPWTGKAWAAEERLFVLVIDGETLDSDLAGVEAAAASHGVDPFDLINDGDDPSKEPNQPILWSSLFAGDEVWLPTGEAGDEGVYGLPQVLQSNQNGATFDFEEFVAGTVSQDDLDKVIDGQPLESAGLQALIGHRILAVAYASDVSFNINDGTFEASLQGDRYGLFLFTVLDTRPNANGFDDILIRVEPASLYPDATMVSVLDENGAVVLEVLPPVADAGFDRRAAPGETLYLDGGGSTDPQSGALLDFAWSLVSAPAGSTALLDDPTAVKPSLTPDLPGDYLVALTVSRQEPTSFDAAEQTSLADQVLISTGNAAPRADAGRDREVNLGDTVQLDGAASFDLDGDMLSYAWVLTEVPVGSTAAFDDAAAPRPRLTVDLDGDYEAQLTVSDGSASSTPDSVIFSTGLLPAKTRAERSLSAAVGETAILRPGDFGQLIEDFEATNLSWCLLARPAGSAAAIGGSNDVRPSLTLDQPGSYVVQLKLRGESGEPQVCTATIDTLNLPPLADAGSDPAAAVGETLVLDAAGSTDLEGDRLSYAWSLLSAPLGSAAALDDPSALRPSLFLDLAGSYVVQLIVSDGSGEAGRPDTVVLDTENTRPRANAGPDQSVAPAATVQLDGSGSLDPDGDGLSHRWTLLEAPDDSGAALSNPAAVSPTFIAPAAGDTLVELVVSDGTLDSEPDTVLITTGNSRPVAEAGSDLQEPRNIAVQLDATASFDADGDPLTFSWALIHAPIGSAAALDDPALATPKLTPDLPGDYVVQLIASDASEPSLPDTLVIAATNQPPVANAGSDQSVTAGDTVDLDGSNSFDPDLDPLTFAWTLSSVPAGSTAVLSDPSAAGPDFVADLAGEYVVDLVVSDGLASSPADQVTITAESGVNLAPVLAAVGNQTVALGSSLSFGLSATDANGDAVSFLASPLPLPAGAGLDSVSGAFAFTPDETQVGDIALTFIASDGLLTDSESVTITVTGAAPGGVTALAGRLLDANDAALGVTTPIVGASVTLLGSGIAPVLSDSNGDFTLTALPAGAQVIDIDSATALAAPDGSAYASFREKITLLSAVVNQIERAVYLPRIDPASITQVVAGQPTIVTNPALGVTMTVAADSAFLNGAPFLGELSISEVPLEFAPVALPPELGFPLLISIQPTGVTFSQPATITFPNLDNMAPGDEVDIYSVDPDTGSFGIVGTGQVNAAGTAIDTISGGINAATWHAPLPPLLGADGSGNSPDIQDPNMCVQCNSGSGTHISSGNLTEDHNLVSYRSLNQPRSLRFVYNSTSADPRPVIVTDTTIPVRSAVPNTISTRLRVGAIDLGETLHTATAGLSENVDEILHQAVQFDAAELATGRYPYRMTVTNHFTRSSVGTFQTGSVLVSNETASPFGAGWTLDGLQRLRLQDNGARAVVTRGDGSTLVFLNGTVVALTGALTQIQPPASVAIGALESDTEIRIFQESNNLTLSGALDVDDITPQGTAAQPAGWHDLAAGVPVNSYLIHFDPLGAPATPVTLDGTITFPTDILGIVRFDGTLDASDGALGAAQTLYPIGAAGRQAEAPDTITLDADLRTLSFTLSSAALADQIRVITASRTEVLVDSRFDTDLEGWTLIDGATGPFYEASGGNPGGHMRIHDQLGSAPGGKAIAPAKFLGDQTAAYGGLWTFDYRNAPPGGPLVSSRDDLRIEGNGLILRYKWPYNPGSSFTRYAVPLVEGYWTDTATGLPPSKPAFQAVLANLTRIWIHADFVNGFDTAFLDNIAFETAAGLAPTQTAYLSPAGDFSTLVDNPDDSFTRTLTNGTAIEYDTDGLMTARVDRNGNTTAYGYDGNDKLVTITDPVGLVTTLAYTGGLLTSVTGPAGRVTGFAHDASGNLTQITDPDTSARIFAYDGRHLLTGQTSKRGFASSYAYGVHGRNTRAGRPDGSFVLTAASEVAGLIDTGAGLGTPANPAPLTRPEDAVASFTDGNGNTTTFGLDKFGGALGRTDALGRTTDTERNTDSKPTRITRRNGRVDEFSYDARGNLLSRTEAVGDALERTTSLEYEPAFNKVTKITDPALNETTFVYDGNGNLVTRTDALTNTTTFTYDARGLVLTGTDRNGEVKTFTYDANGNLDTITDAELNVTDFTRDAAGNLTQIVQGLSTPEARTTDATYDARNRLLTATDGAGGTAEIRYDAAGNVEELEDATGRIEFRNYDTRNRVVQVDNPVTGITATAYDGNGNATTVTDTLLNVTTVEFDAGNRATKQIDALLDERLFGYDDEDSVTSVTDARGNPTSFAYDLLNRVTSRTNPLSESASFTYDSRDNLVTATDPKSQVTTNTYDDLNRLTQVLTPDNLIALGFDPEGNVTTVADDDSELSFTHDGLNRILTASTVAGGVQPLVTLTNTYDAVGDRISLTDDAGLAGAVTGFAFDGAGRLTQLTTPAGQPIGLGYDPAGRVTGMTFPNTVSTTVTYELATGRLSQLTHAAGVTPLADFGYGFNGVGSIASVTELTQTRNFAYDDLQRLTAGGTVATPETYAYDGEGNRTASHLSAAHTTDIANRLSEDDDFAYAYDLNGNLTSKTAKAGGAVTDYTYDAQDQLTRIDFPDLTAAEYRYDGLGRRIEKDVDGTVTQYVYDGSDILAEFDGPGTLLARYSHGDRIDQPLGVERGGQSYYYQADHLGSVRKITDSAGIVVNSYDYDSYGNIEASVEGISNPYTYTGREFDAESGLYFYRARYYDAATGRFLAEDPIGFGAGDANLYRYVSSNPLNFVDPYGLAELLAITTGTTANLGLLGIDTGFLYVVDIGTGQIEVFSYAGGGFGPGIGLAATAEVGFLEATNLEDITGFGGAVSGFLAQGFAVSTTGFGSTSGEGIYGGTAGAGYGFGFGVAGLFTYTNYVGTINLEDLTEPVRELLDSYLGGQCSKR